ncbi:putative reverse transcriptase domain-containing protein [Tanacetum coccineum]
MTKLTQKSVKFEWGEKAEAAFQLLKQKLCSAPILALPEGSENFVVYCDASHKGLGAVLMQREKVIAYASRQLKHLTAAPFEALLYGRKCRSHHLLGLKLETVSYWPEIIHETTRRLIMDREVKRLKQSRIPIVKVRWNSRRGPEFTWRAEDKCQRYETFTTLHPLQRLRPLSFEDIASLTGKECDNRGIFRYLVSRFQCGSNLNF